MIPIGILWSTGSTSSSSTAANASFGRSLVRSSTQELPSLPIDSESMALYTLGGDGVTLNGLRVMLNTKVDAKSIGQAVRAARMLKKSTNRIGEPMLSQNELSMLVECDHSAISSIEIGRSLPTITMLTELGNVLGIPAAMLILAATDPGGDPWIEEMKRKVLDKYFLGVDALEEIVDCFP